MTDLAQQIRDRFDEPAWRNLLRVAGGQVMRRAILAVVDLHAADASGFCHECSDEFPAAWPCPTVRTIADNLAIEVNDGRA